MTHDEFRQSLGAEQEWAFRHGSQLGYDKATIRLSIALESLRWGITDRGQMADEAVKDKRFDEADKHRKQRSWYAREFRQSAKLEHGPDALNLLREREAARG